MTNFVQKSFAQFGRPERNSSDDASGSPQKHLSPKKNPFGGNKIKVSHEPLNRKPSGVVHEQEDEGIVQVQPTKPIFKYFLQGHYLERG